MFAREYVKPKAVDVISQGVGVPRYLAPWYPDKLSAAIYGPGRKPSEPIRVSRYYPEARVVVDFEPHPRVERFYYDEKRLWCRTERIVYVPIFLADALTLDQFVVRLREARQDYAADHVVAVERRALDGAAPEATILRDPSIALWVDREAARLVDAGVAEGKNWRGFARTHKLTTFKREIVREMLRRYPSGNVGPEYRTDVAPVAARGR